MATRNIKRSSPARTKAATALSDEQRRNYGELLAWARAKEKEYAALPLKQRAREQEEWEAVLRGMNADRTRSGSRRLTVDPD